jgi:DNA-binding NtrC family response regulator
VRELKNLVERGVLTGTEPELTAADLALLPGEGSPPGDGISPDMELPPIPPSGIDFPSLNQLFEKYYIETALKMASGNESEAARLLNINHHTFRYHRKKLDIKTE